MGYVPLNNYNYDSGYKRIQSGPNHQGFIVLTSGSSAYGVNEGIIVPGSPLSGTPTLGTWDFDSNWRYAPRTLHGQSGSLDRTPYNASGALDTYDATRIYTRDNVAGAQAASAIGPETGKVNSRNAALQPRADVTRPEKYMYFGGGAPDNQDYSPYNTPDANTAAEGKTGGGVTHRNYESSLLTNVLGSQGTSDRSQWRYHQPVYCKTYTETQRSTTPGLMSSPLRYVYRGQATSYNYNYGSELLAYRGMQPEREWPQPPQPIPAQAKLLIIGSPYFSLDLPDPTAVQNDLTRNTWLGCQTLTYAAGIGLLVQNGGAIARDESVSNNTRAGYQEISLYSLDGVFIRRIGYQRTFFNTYYYSFEARRFNTQLPNGNIVGALSNNDSLPDAMEMYIVSPDLTQEIQRFAFTGLDTDPDSLGRYGFPQTLTSNASTGKVLMINYPTNSFTLGEYIALYAFDINLTPSWAYFITNDTVNYFSDLFPCDAVSVQINNIERNLIVGWCLDTSLYREASLVVLDDQGDEVNAWGYRNTSAYINDIPSFNIFEEVAWDVCLDLNQNIILSGYTTIEPIIVNEGENDTSGLLLIKIDAATGDVLQSSRLVIVNLEYFGIDFFSPPSHVVDSDGSIYVSFGAYIGAPVSTEFFGAEGAFVLKLSSNFELQKSLFVGHQSGGVSLCINGMELADDKIVLAGFFYSGPWAGPNIGGTGPNDALVAILDKNAFLSDTDVSGAYWVDGVPGGPGLYIFDVTEYCELRDTTITKTQITTIKSSIAVSVQGPSTYSAAVKEPTSVVLTKQ